jgi:serine/threonine-protein kinase
MQPSGAPVCPKCSAEVREGWKICPACLAPLIQGVDTQTAHLPGSSPPSSGSVEEGRFPAGTVLAGRYRILGLLGHGGMGEVYRAYDLILNQAVALKFLSVPELSEAALARFRNEVRVARQVSHPNVCRVYDIGFIDGLHFLSMEYLDGEDLDSLLRRIGRLPQDKAIEFTRKICAGLAAAHERGVLHRDLKPANIMIDGRGQVRITDFGLAGLAAEIPLSDLRSGTPAYMSPEQKAGREVTTRSDLYSLGLVLHEMFTGKRRTGTQTNPSDLVKDLDPAVERVILRCLEEDPKRRPSSAFNVALGLPGGDPIAAALAAGETPSPEMVAASGEKEGLQPRTAVLCFAGVIVCLVAMAFLSARTTLLGVAPLPLPPDALAFQARGMLKQFGYAETPVDSAYGFYSSPDRDAYLRYFRQHDFANGWTPLATHQPALTRFFYRQSPDYLRPEIFLAGPHITAPANGFIQPDDPPNIQPGMIRVSLDPNGKLVELDVRPTTASSGAGRAIDWNSLLAAAGLDPTRFTSVTPQSIPPMYADSVMAWTGTYANGQPDPIRVEAAALRGRPVSFTITGAWNSPGIAPGGGQLTNTLITGLVVAASLIAAFVAWRNLRLGRVDRQGAWTIAKIMFAAAMLRWVLTAAHEPSFGEVNLLIMALSSAAFFSGVIGILYLAIEPYVRRTWPDALISLNRFTSGRFRDPLVASHILAGLVVGMAMMIVGNLLLLASRLLDTIPAENLSGFRFIYGSFLSVPQNVAFTNATVILILVLLRPVLRRNWLVDVIAVALFVLPSWGHPLDMLDTALGGSLNLWTLRRFGVLAQAAYLFLFFLRFGVPWTPASWYAAYSLTAPFLLATVSGYALYTIVRFREMTKTSAWH